jgi:hypothetical protein
MKYALLIYYDQVARAQTSQEEQEASYQAYTAFGDEIERRGVLIDGRGLQPTTSATTVQVRHGQNLITDGPFAETKEQLAGFYVLDCRDLDEAIELATMIPSATHGSIEIRPLAQYD